MIVQIEIKIKFYFSLDTFCIAIIALKILNDNLCDLQSKS